MAQNRKPCVVTIRKEHAIFETGWGFIEAMIGGFNRRTLQRLEPINDQHAIPDLRSFRKPT